MVKLSNITQNVVMTTSYLCCSKQLREYSALSLSAGREFRECSMVAECLARCVVTAIDVFSRRAGSVLCTTIAQLTGGVCAAAAASRSFLTEPCSALLRRNITSTCGRDGDSGVFIKSSFFSQNCSKQWWNKAWDQVRVCPYEKTSFIDEKAVRYLLSSCTMSDRQSAWSMVC